MPALTRKELDVHGCDRPGCTETHDPMLYLHGRCHPSAPTWAAYDKSSGILTVSCSTCRKVVAQVQVAA